MAISIVGVRIKNSGKLFYFSPANVWPKRGDKVIVETIYGQVLGDVIIGVKSVDDEMITIPLKPVLRIATDEDIAHQKELEEFAVRAFVECKAKIAEHNLDMKLVRVEPMFDDTKIMFYFTANQRIDFRNLVKDLASMYKKRIELRQIGVRDEAKIIGTLGVCGRKVCCASFLSNFQPVSIKMAKEQTLSLNPTKISGACGRLMCCLKYEQDYYDQMHKIMPKLNHNVQTPDGEGTVTEINVIMETVKVKIEKDDTVEIKTYTLDQINNPESYRSKKEEKQLSEFEQFIINEKAKTKEDTDSKDKQVASKDTETKTKVAKANIKKNNAKKNKASDASLAGLRKKPRVMHKNNTLSDEKKKKLQSSWQKAVEKAIAKTEKK